MQKQLHIAMLIGALTRGGSERVLVNLADYLIGRGWQVTMVTQYKKENEYPLNPQVKRVICDLTEEELSTGRVTNFKRRFCKLRRIWKQEKPDVILSFIGKNNIMSVMTSRFLKIPVAVSVRGEPSMEYYNAFMKVAAKTVFHMADGVILQTERCREFFPKGISRKSVILKNPMNEAFFREPYQGEREKVIVSVGRVDENKNHQLLIRAFAQIADQFPEYKLIIYGEGVLRADLIKEVKQMGLEDRISLPGAVSDVAEAIYKTGVFVLPSNTEGVPNTLIEAMLLGLAVIATDCPCGGPADLIKDGENGILTPVGDLDKMKENLQRTLGNLQMMRKMQENALKLRDSYHFEQVYGDWESYLGSLVRRK